MPSRSERLLRLIALFCFGAVGVALVSQHVFDMPPCAWCVMQRLIYLVIGVIALVGGFGGGRVLTRLCGALTALLSLSGIAAAWYQYSVAANMLSCDQTFADRFMTGIGLESAVPWLFGIYATCMDAKVPVLGIEYALWSLALFVIIFFMALPVAFRRGSSQ
ncbi:disulfide bond formation protein B [Achromobacter insolitus]|uniref:Disulfide bond formation protein B n=1 Tax=Achromobacter insolitus TaxID=217204 RepID=A0A6S7F9W7_9BURK|nr:MULTISPECIES: disulfide bond formation protein B [Achromobacter]GLK93947.1 disulfide bond formation protein DsbB [Achromobacter xylosoxidans]APX74152.1 disulfide bond formation protein B [Achromobacter insolitus]AXA69681.1 disulfide bond formation protein B [Achromobacter insolitus]MCP1403721.1 disulfide bond formation protein DsbB [Achromobacter insolitus]MDH3065030.1 disulfide bond formation protein B [Achromobacter insolitus]